MNINLPVKVAVILLTVVLGTCSVITCYLDLDGTVEVRDLPEKNERELRLPDFYGEWGDGVWDDDHIDNRELPGGKDASDGEDATLAEGGDGETDGKAEEEPARLPASEDPDLPHWEPSGEYVELDRLVLVNKEYPAGADFVPQDLVQVAYRASDRSAEWQVMTREAADAFNALAEGALAEGHEIVVTTAYRSYNFQSYLYNSYVEKDGQTAADTYSAQPGKSEHQTGLTADVSSPSVGYKLTRDYGETAEGKWLAENCWKYGFIIRFPDGMESITGYTYEPWHIRYVGQDAAREIFEQGVTLEEYLGKEPAAE